MQETQPTTTFESVSEPSAGQRMHDLACRLFPIHRSLTGEGNRQTLRLLQTFFPIELVEVPTGTSVFDWTVGQEWNVRDAWVADESGDRLIDYRKSTLHLVNGSNPVDAWLTWEQLKPHIHTLPDRPDWIPYRTDFHTDGWGFCMAHRDFEVIEQSFDPAALFHVVVDTNYEDGSLTYGEAFLPGQTDREVLLYAHLCHPSLANDNLSGIVVATELLRHLASANRYHSFRLVLAPATLGAITWLAQNEAKLPQISHGLILTLLGDNASICYKKSRRGDASMDAAAEHLHGEGTIGAIEEFSPTGYDERQFCSPGINLPMGRIMRSSHGQFAEYHTSADDLDFISAEALEESLDVCIQLVNVVEQNRVYLNRKPKGEPRLGDYGIYRAFGEGDDRGRLQEAILWLLNLADGTHDLLSISKRSQIPFSLLVRAADLLSHHGLMVRVGGEENQ